MPKIALLNVKGEKIKDIKLSDEVFGIEPNNQTIYDAVVLKQASMRQGTHKVKTRSEVSGGGRKPWRQKGTGNARQGSIRAPHFVGGGVVFGPTTERNYTKKQNRKERRLASQPLDYPSCGSVFRNPEGMNAWECIDGIGYRGKSVGDACVSEKHCNFIINKGHATAKDYISLIVEIQTKVKEKYDIDLETEMEMFNWSDKD